MTYRDGQKLHVGWWRLYWPLGVLCLLAGSRWLLDEAWPPARSTTLSAGTGCVVAAGFLFICRTWWERAGNARVQKPRAGGGWTFSLAAAVLLTAPVLSGVISDRHLNANAATLALALTPVVVAVSAAASDTETELAGLVWPGLAGLAGLLLLLPQPSLSSWRTDVGLAAMPLLSGLAAIYLGARNRAEGSAQDVTGIASPWVELGLLLAGLLFGLVLLPGLPDRVPVAFSWVACGADGLISVLTLLVLRRVGAMRWSAQFMLTPLLTILEGVVLLRPTLTPRSWIGLLLMFAGGSYLLVPRPEHGEALPGR